MTHETLRHYYIREAESLLLNNPELARGLGGFDFVELYADARIMEFELNHSPPQKLHGPVISKPPQPYLSRGDSLVVEQKADTLKKRKRWGVLSI